MSPTLTLAIAALAAACIPPTSAFGGRRLPRLARSRSYPDVSPPRLQAAPPQRQEDQGVSESSVDADFLKDETATSGLPPLPPPVDPDDDAFRSMRANLPVSSQHFLRDSGLLRLLSDALFVAGIPSIVKEHPTLLRSFLRLSGVELPFGMLSSGSEKEGRDFAERVKFETVSYGEHPSQNLEIMSTQRSRSSGNKKVLFFCHGGFWGSGKPFMYRNIAETFLERNYTVVMWGYRTYPSTTEVDGQVQDFCSALDYVATHLGPASRPEITVVGHSSGGHVALLSLLNNPRYSAEGTVSNLVSLSGLYDIPSHHLHEASRGVEEVSPLKPICGGSPEAWEEVSPTQIVTKRKRQSPSSPRGGEETPRPLLPRTLIVHGAKDTVVPYTSALGFANAYDEATFELLTETGHACTVMDLMLGGATGKCVSDWLEGKEGEVGIPGVVN